MLVVIALACCLLTAPAAAVPNMETHAYYSVVAEAPYAPYTVAGLRATSIVAYHSVVADEPYAAYTTPDEFKRTSLLPYYSVLH